MNEILAKLAEPFPPERISWRVGPTTQDKSKGQALAFIDARDVMERLDSVVGPANWQRRYSHAGEMCICEIGIKLGEEWVWKADGAGETDFEKEKGALSAAFKRAAVNWGIGRYLYDLEAPWVAIKQRGRSYVIAEHEMERLQRILRGEKPKSARAAHKDNDWKELAEGLKHCQTTEDVHVYLNANAKRIAEMPDGWRDRWRELVDSTMDSVRARAA